MTTKQHQSPPSGLRAGGRRLWNAVAVALELDERDRSLLIEAARCRDRLDVLDAAVRRDGLFSDGRLHPGAVEARQQALVLARLLTAMRLPEDLQNPAQGQRPQRRGVRGVYEPRRLRVVAEGER